MAIRIFQHYWQLPLALLALVEAVAFFLAPWGAALLSRYAGLPADPAALFWERGLVFAGVMFLSMTAMGLYNARQRSRLTGVLARVAASVFGSAMLIAILAYLVPSLEITCSSGACSFTVPAAARRASHACVVGPIVAASSSSAMYPRKATRIRVCRSCKRSAILLIY